MEFDQHLKSKGMVRSLTVHDTPEHNGIAEKLNCTLVEHAQVMHYAADLPKFLWMESIQHAAWLKNRTTTYQLDGETPFEMLFGKKPDLSDLPEWGVKVWVLKEERGKLDAKADGGQWVGYSRESKAHRIYWPGKQRVTNEHNISFNDTITIPSHDTSSESNHGTPRCEQYATLDLKKEEVNPSKTLKHEVQQQPTPDPLQIPRTDPLADFEPPDPMTELKQEGQGQRMRKLSAYV